MTIPSSLVKQLRDKTHAGMMDCKKALTESHGDLEAAMDWLRVKGITKAAQKSDRITSEGVIALATTAQYGSIIELNTETDFAARHAVFQTLAQNIASLGLVYSTDLLHRLLPQDNQTVEQAIQSLISHIGENIILKRTQRLEVEQGVIASYIHNRLGTHMGRIGVLVALESTVNQEQLYELGKKIAMHIVAAQPQAIDIQTLDPQRIERERNIFLEQTQNSGKPENIIEHMVQGRLRKFYEEVVLMEQIFVIDGRSKVKDVVAEYQKQWNAPVLIKDFIHFRLGQ